MTGIPTTRLISAPRGLRRWGLPLSVVVAGTAFTLAVAAEANNLNDSHLHPQDNSDKSPTYFSATPDSNTLGRHLGY